ncbi:NifB/NifX family molybdenum-iron cluster-binding protein [Clostridium intestinale]|uniref:NifB/NifX family molybdenum-iron cluster-binding protein n=1 Tax=Clostridium intestinale TaxID=36845 RepID=UPI002DD6A4C1|nr:NifB/NifX family molybdenum-iron cluster-binding protein [Clostridium intestinale]WRY52462.1 NifB/NifX family molybdenum-iron cluster-binding protein [Clostridium intestinale]
MGVKIAAGSSDGIVIDQHFGSGNKFYIFELLEDGNFNILDIREGIDNKEDFLETYDEVKALGCNENSSGSCGSGCSPKEHNNDDLYSKVKLLNDCDMVLINRIGKFAEKLLLKNGISALEAEGDIKEAFSSLFKYYKRIKKL